ncbi:DUF6307 family protein [Amycolatopsis acidiphila]|uniref:Uncharacterized protein n=1 Tax=Amycolatopsis acidiphila TaxID=715473 RepID=A0A557ZYT6_9PSEU|nr:DUF6307 family protein [Amycolatopsis acidiphila]TVT17169.1 hypothetical protein FNH06_32470 [Amycolatopsis acidiphila]UIJ63070.1 DUF6307 family protein [Amycolatopsis acidiphila]
MTLQKKEEELMIQNPTFVSQYQKRVELVHDVLRHGTELSEEQSRVLAVDLLHTLDTLPERVR